MAVASLSLLASASRAASICCFLLPLSSPDFVRLRRWPRLDRRDFSVSWAAGVGEPLALGVRETILSQSCKVEPSAATRLREQRLEICLLGLRAQISN